MQNQMEKQLEWKLGLGVVYADLGFPQIRGTFLGVPIGRIIIFWDLHWGPPLLGNCHIIKERTVLRRCQAALGTEAE